MPACGTVTTDQPPASVTTPLSPEASSETVRNFDHRTRTGTLQAQVKRTVSWDCDAVSSVAGFDTIGVASSTR